MARTITRRFAATAPTQWYEEKAAFDAAPNKTGFNAANPDWFNRGHYMQMMWSATTKIGCGTAPGPLFASTSCRYSPPGNFDGEPAYPGADTMQVPASPHRTRRHHPPPAPPQTARPAQTGPPARNGAPADEPAPAPAPDAAPAQDPPPDDEATPTRGRSA